MRTAERLITYTGLAMALGLSLSAYVSSNAGSRAMADTSGALWHAADESANLKIASCDVFKVAGKLMGTDRFKKPIEDKQNEFKAQVTPLDNELKAIVERAKAMGPNASGPEAQALAEEYKRKEAELIRLSQDLDRQMNKFVAEKNYEAYKDVLDAINVIAEQRAYTHVFSTRSVEEMKSPETAPAFLQGVLARPLAKSPSGDDITEDVIAELKL